MSVTFVTSTVLQAVDKASAPLKKMRSNAQRLERQFRAVKIAARGMSDAGRTITTRFSAPVAGLGLNSIRMAANFDNAMNTVQSKLLISTKAMQVLRDEAQNLGATTQFSATEAGEAMGFLAQAGFNTEKILKTTASTLNLAAAGGLELAESADIASNVLGAFRLDKGNIEEFGQNFDRVSSVLALASARSNLSVQEFAESLKTAAPVAAEFGITIEQSGAMLGMLANMGIKGTESGTAMRNMLANLISPAGAAGKAFSRLGLSTESFFTKNEQGRAVFSGTTNMLTALTDAGANQADLFDIFGKRTAPKIMALLGAGSKSIEELESSLMDQAAASKMAQIRMQGLPGILKLLASAWEAINLKIVETGALDPVINAITNLTKHMQELVANPERIDKLVSSIKSVVVVGAGLWAAGAAMSFAANAVIVFGTFAPALIAFAKSGKIAAGAMWLINAAMAANPITLVVGAIGLLAAAFFAFANDPIQILVNAWEGMKDVFFNVVDGIKRFFFGFISWYLKKVKVVTDALSFVIPDSIAKGLDDQIAKFENLSNADLLVNQNLSNDSNQIAPQDIIGQSNVPTVTNGEQDKVALDVLVKTEEGRPAKVSTSVRKLRRRGSKIGRIGTSMVSQ